MPSVHAGLVRHLYIPHTSALAHHAVLAAMPKKRSHTGAGVAADSGSGGDTPDGQASSSSDAYQGQTNYTPTSGGGSTPAGVVSSLLGDLGGVLGGGGSSSTTSSSSTSSSSSQSNVQAPNQTTYTPAPSPAPYTTPSPAPIVPHTTTAPAKSHLLWWILGGVAVVTVGFIAWRLFGHKGVAATATSAAKAASYYGW